MAHYAQTVNVLGAIKTSRTAAEMEATGLVLQLYRARFGEIPLTLTRDVGPLDVAAALTGDGRALTLGIVNPTDAAVSLPLRTDAGPVTGRATRWHIGGATPGTHNTPGQVRAVDIQCRDGIDAAEPLEIPAMSCAVFRVPLRP